MPREVNTRPDVRQQVQTNQQTPGLRVVAQQVNTVADPGTNTGTQLLSALSAVRPQLQQYIDVKQDEANQADVLKGQQAAMTLSDAERRIALGNMKREQSPFFQNGYMKMHGQLEARTFKNELESALADPEQFNPDVGDIGAFAQERLNASMQGMDDKDFLAAYLPHAEAAVAGVKAQYVATKSAEVIEKANNGSYAIVESQLADSIKAKRSFSVEERNKWYADNRALGITYRASDELLFKAAAVQALSGEGHPEVMDIFNERSTDGTQPGMAHSATWGEKIRAIRDRAGDMLAAAKKKKDSVRNLQTWDSLSQLVSGSGVDRQVLLGMLAPKVASGEITDGDAHSFINKNTETLKDNAIVAKVSDGLRTKNLDGSAGVPKPLLERAIAGVDEEMRARHGDDLPAYVGEAMQVFAANNVIPETLKHRLNSANPLSNPEAFHRTAREFIQFNARDPNFIQRHVDAGQSLMYGAYRDAIEFDGASPEQALRIAAEVSDPESHKRLAALMTKETRDTIASTAKAMVQDGNSYWPEMFGGGADIKNTAYVQDTVDRMMTSYLLRRRGSTDGAAKWAAERFQATHTNIAGRWLPTQGQPNSPLAHPKFGEAATFAAEKYAETVRAGGKVVPEGGYYIAPDYQTRADGKYGIYRNDGSLASEGVRVDPQVGVLQPYMKSVKGKQMSWSDIQAEQQRNAQPTPSLEVMAP